MLVTHSAKDWVASPPIAFRRKHNAVCRCRCVGDVGIIIITMTMIIKIPVIKPAMNITDSPATHAVLLHSHSSPSSSVYLTILRFRNSFYGMRARDRSPRPRAHTFEHKNDYASSSAHTHNFKMQMQLSKRRTKCNTTALRMLCGGATPSAAPGIYQEKRCGACLAHGARQRCPRCGIRYCNAKCQALDWKERGHKRRCNTITHVLHMSMRRCVHHKKVAAGGEMIEVPPMVWCLGLNAYGILRQKNADEWDAMLDEVAKDPTSFVRDSMVRIADAKVCSWTECDPAMKRIVESGCRPVAAGVFLCQAAEGHLAAALSVVWNIIVMPRRVWRDETAEQCATVGISPFVFGYERAAETKTKTKTKTHTDVGWPAQVSRQFSPLDVIRADIKHGGSYTYLITLEPPLESPSSSSTDRVDVATVDGLSSKAMALLNDGGDDEKVRQAMRLAINKRVQRPVPYTHSLVLEVVRGKGIVVQGLWGHYTPDMWLYFDRDLFFIDDSEERCIPGGWRLELVSRPRYRGILDTAGLTELATALTLVCNPAASNPARVAQLYSDLVGVTGMNANRGDDSPPPYLRITMCRINHSARTVASPMKSPAAPKQAWDAHARFRGEPMARVNADPAELVNAILRCANAGSHVSEATVVRVPGGFTVGFECNDFLKNKLNQWFYGCTSSNSNSEGKCKAMSIRVAEEEYVMIHLLLCCTNDT